MRLNPRDNMSGLQQVRNRRDTRKTTHGVRVRVRARARVKVGARVGARVRARVRAKVRVRVRARVRTAWAFAIRGSVALQKAAMTMKPAMTINTFRVRDRV